MEATARILFKGEVDEKCSRVFVVNEAKKAVTFVERLIKVPVNVNRHALHAMCSKFTNGGAAVIEWSGDVSIMVEDDSATIAPTGRYHCYTIDAQDVIPQMLRLHSLMDRNDNKISMAISDALTPAAFAEAMKRYNQCFGTRVEWCISYALGMFTSQPNGTLTMDRVRLGIFYDDPTKWRVLPALKQDVTGWSIDGVTAVHSPRFGAQLALPPMGLSFTMISDEEDPPSFDETMRTSPDRATLRDDLASRFTSQPLTSGVARVESRDARQRQRIEELELHKQRLADYVSDLADRLNPRLPERMRIKSVRDVIDGAAK